MTKRRHILVNIEAEIKAKLNLPKSQLYETLGAELSGQPFVPDSAEEMIREAMLWIKEKRKQLVTKICSNEKVRSFRNDINRLKSRVLLVSAMCDAVSSVVHGTALVTVCVILFQEGIEVICKNG